MNGQSLFEKKSQLKGWLLVLNGNWRGKDYRLHYGRNVVGSSHNADIYLPETNIEPFHFSIRFDESGAWLTDLDSESGLYIAGEKIHRAKIEDETLINVSQLEVLIKMF